MKSRIIIGTIALLAVIMFAAPQASRADTDSLAKQVSYIVIGSRGITQKQAHVLADAYIAAYLARDAGRVPHTPAFREGRYWLVPVWVHSGSARNLAFQPVVPAGRIRIDRFTGATSYPRHPKVSPKDLAARPKA